MGRGRSKKKLILEIPEPGMADLDDDDPPATPEPAPVPKSKKTKPAPEPEPVAARPKKKSEPVKDYPPGEYWRQDGKQYDVSLQDAKEKNKYQSFDESDDLADAKDLANNAAFEDGRVAIVWDRKLAGICYRIDPNAPLEETEEKKGKKK